MKTIRFVAIILTSILANSCALKAPIITKNDSIEGYKYVFIPTTSDLTSGTGGVYGGQYGGVYGYSSSKSVNPSDVISGILLKKGFICLPEIKQEFAGKTLIVNYGESGRRNIAGGFGGYTIEVTIKLISAKSYKTMCSCTAEGQGATEADDIREAITRCLSGLLSKEN